MSYTAPSVPCPRSPHHPTEYVEPSSPSTYFFASAQGTSSRRAMPSDEPERWTCLVCDIDFTADGHLV
jgi:hypothetical protein